MCNKVIFPMRRPPSPSPTLPAVRIRLHAPATRSRSTIEQPKKPRQASIAALGCAFVARLLVALLIAERDKLNRAIEALEGTKTPAIHTPVAETPKKKRHISATTRRKNGAGAEETLRGFESGENIRLFGCETDSFWALYLGTCSRPLADLESTVAQSHTLFHILISPSPPVPLAFSSLRAKDLPFRTPRGMNVFTTGSGRNTTCRWKRSSFGFARRWSWARGSATGKCVGWGDGPDSGCIFW